MANILDYLIPGAGLAQSLFGGGKPSGADELAGLMGSQYKQWSGPALQALWNIFQTGETPAELSQKRGMESDFQKYAQQLYGGVTGDALSRGLGNSSIFASNIFGAGRTAANMLAQGRTGLLQSQEARRMQALQALFGGIGAQAGTAMTGLTNQQNQWQQGQAGMSDALAQLWYQIGQRNNPSGGTGPTTASTIYFSQPAPWGSPRPRNMVNYYPGQEPNYQRQQWETANSSGLF